MLLCYVLMNLCVTPGRTASAQAGANGETNERKKDYLNTFNKVSSQVVISCQEQHMKM